MKVKVKLPIKHWFTTMQVATFDFNVFSHTSPVYTNTIINLVDDIMLWCMERDISIDLYKVEMHPDKSVHAVFIIDKDDTFMMMLGHDMTFHKVSHVSHVTL